MNAEIIAVGTELLLGETVNTDAADVARLLSELGINVYWQTVVGDNRRRLEQSVALARTRADIIITTGGLGPTCDDLTKEVVAGAFGLKLVLNEAEEARLRGLVEAVSVPAPARDAAEQDPGGARFQPAHQRR